MFFYFVYKWWCLIWWCLCVMWWRICLPLMVFDRMIFMCNVVENWLVRSIIAAVVLVGVFTINLPFFILLLVLLDHHLHHSPPMDTAILIFFVCVCIFAYICSWSLLWTPNCCCCCCCVVVMVKKLLIFLWPACTLFRFTLYHFYVRRDRGITQKKKGFFILSLNTYT